jgi:phospholipid/cholesterol/gamma-HCH transport system ATP-binding protein
VSRISVPLDPDEVLRGAPPQGPMISLRNLRVAYGGREILHGISFDVQRGETMVILGGSGSGKSTLLRTLVGLEKPSSGEVWIQGKNFSTISDDERDDIRKKLGMSFQGGALFGSMTVGENVALPLREHTKLEDSTIEIMVRLKLDQVGLSGFEDYMPSELSGGMKKRAAVARALAMDPEILFFDEPSAGLDPIIAAGIDQLILELKKAFHMTIIVVTHELASAFLIADRMVLINKGDVTAIGTVKEMQNSTQPKVRQFLDRVPEAAVAEELDYLQMLTEPQSRAGESRQEKSR